MITGSRLATSNAAIMILKRRSRRWSVSSRAMPMPNTAHVQVEMTVTKAKTSKRIVTSRAIFSAVEL